MRKTRLIACSLIIALLSSLLLSGCKDTQSGSEQINVKTNNVTIALQYGLAYAPLQIMKENNLMEKYLPGANVEWKQLGTGPVIREAIIANKVDVGFMGISPFLIGWDKGAQWKIATASACSPLGLQTYKDEIKNLSDFDSEDRIASPAIGSIQHILLAMAAEKQLGNARALDNIQVALTHPDAAAALLSKKDITGHFTSPPYIFQELSNKDIHQVIGGEDAFGGEFTFIFGVASEKFHDSNPVGYAAFIAAFNEAVAFINNNPQEAAKILAPQYKLSEDKTLEYITWDGSNYCTTPYGILGFAEFMNKSGYISKMPENISEIAFENVQAAIGKRYGGLSSIEKLQLRK